MKKFVLGSVALIAFGVTAASAADLRAPPPPVPVTPSLYSPVSVYNWTGFYAGLNGGAGWGTVNGQSVSGGLFGATAGYNFQSGPWVLGLEGDVDWANLTGGGQNLQWLGTLRGRAGYSYDRLLPYVTTGPVLATGTGGWSLGAGVEYAFTPAWSGKIEYLYAWLNSSNASVLRAGVNYHFR